MWIAKNVVEAAHAGAAGGLGYVDVGLHGGVGLVARPLHYDGGEDAGGEAADDEGLSAGVAGDVGVLRGGVGVALRAPVGGDGDGGVDVGEFGDVAEVTVVVLMRGKVEIGRAHV